MAVLGFKNQAVATAEISKLVTSFAAVGAGMVGWDLPTALIAGFATQVVTTGIGFLPGKGKKNPYNAHDDVYSQNTHESEVDMNRREVRREMEMVEAPDDEHLFVGGFDEQADDEFADQFVGGTDF